MIGHLRGILSSKKPPFLIIDVNGLGYEVQSSMTTIYELPEIGEVVSLYTHLVVREDAQLLYAFVDERERIVFRELIKVSGVGPKLALAILSGMDVPSFIRCIEKQESNCLVKLPGVGKKTAERLIIEMRDKLDKHFSAGHAGFSEVLLESGTVHTNNFAQQEAVSALIALGYKPQEANIAVRKVVTDGANCETLIRLALQDIAR